MKKVLFIIFVFTLLGCSKGMDAKVDSSSKENYEKSLKTIQSQISPQENERLENALKVIALPNINDKDNIFSALAKLADVGKIEKKFLKAVNGKTPREIIALADEKIRERQKSELKSINAEIVELENKKAKYAQSKEILSKIVVSNEKFYWTKDKYFSEPVIALKVSNNSGIPLSHLFFHGTISTPGRAISWIDEDFNYSVRGGLEPGESKYLQLTPNQFSVWGNREVKERTDTVFTVKVVNARDAKGNDIAQVFTEDNKKRFAELQKMKVQLEEKFQINN